MRPQSSTSETASDQAKGTTVTPLTRSWERAVPAQDTPDGLETLRAAECGECHSAIYEEWKTTAHALALEDLQFQAEWRKDDNLWLCLNCHTPLENQLERIVTGLKNGDFRSPVAHPNDRFDATLRDEGITCAACHVRDGTILGPGLAEDAPHPVASGAGLLSQQMCEGCHNVQEQLSETLICTFATGDEWRASGLAEEGKGCIDCHMPAVMRPLVEGGDVRPGHEHTWMGAGVAKLPQLVEPLRMAHVPGYDVEVRARRTSSDTGEKVLIDASIMNARAGHELPTGDPERFITLDLVLLDDSDVSHWSHTERIGELWEWAPEAKQISDNSLKPGERREFHYAVSLSHGVDDLLFVEIIARNHRMTEENARAMGIYGRYPLAVETIHQYVSVVEAREERKVHEQW